MNITSFWWEQMDHGIVWGVTNGTLMLNWTKETISSWSKIWGTVINKTRPVLQSTQKFIICSILATQMLIYPNTRKWVMVIQWDSILAISNSKDNTRSQQSTYWKPISRTIKCGESSQERFKWKQEKNIKW